MSRLIFILALLASNPAWAGSCAEDITYMQYGRGDDKICQASLVKPKRMLRIW